MSSATTIPTGGPSVAPSTEAPAAQGAARRTAGAPALVAVGDTVLVQLGDSIIRPLLITCIGRYTPPNGPIEVRINGTLFCEPDDHNSPAFRRPGSSDPSEITGRPTLQSPCCFAYMLREGRAPGEWTPRSTNLPARS
jgi:hypothetical protein